MLIFMSSLTALPAAPSRAFETAEKTATKTAETTASETTDPETARSEWTGAQPVDPDRTAPMERPEWVEPVERDAAADPGTTGSTAGTTPPAPEEPEEPEGSKEPEASAADPRRRRLTLALRALAVIAGAAGLVWMYLALPAPAAGLPSDGRTVLVVFAATLACWTLTRLDDTFVGTAAVAVLIVAGVVPHEHFLGLLGSDTVWLLVAACVLAAGLERSGLPARDPHALLVRPATVRRLVHLVTAGVVLTALAIPSTSGRAALALPVFLALAKVFAERPAVVRALALVFPATILLSAIATLIGAAAHLIGNGFLEAMTGSG